MGANRVSEVSHRVLTVPNVLSFLRLLMVPVFLALIIGGQDGYALLVLVISSVTDFLDGQIARRFHQVSRLGQLLDPAADRLFIFTALVGLAIREVIPWWLFVAIVARDAMLLVLGIVGANFGYGPLPVHHLGKMGTFALLAAMPIFVLGAAFPEATPVTNPVGWAAALWGVFLYWWAGIVYALQAGRQIRIPRDAHAPSSDSLDH